MREQIASQFGINSLLDALKQCTLLGEEGKDRIITAALLELAPILAELALELSLSPSPLVVGRKNDIRSALIGAKARLQTATRSGEYQSGKV